ncbi:MAG TPA: SIS domain-containing protein [Candidatus Krumholzibacteria bacterium]|nr:SIS domain-containing protein [Candidatus Krumholzibacteria bacterium]HPD71298.1 SIS domain-containing protein [Candidatus Krumholzibacteria bacterium]HRY39002.1 SIS domain-containing protein [Candidatus Krumholzibacteria bacterium]
MSRSPATGQRRMFAWIAGLPGQLRQSGRLPGLDTVRPPRERPAQVLICGMGGSAMAGSVVADDWPGLAVPVRVWRDAGLPAWAGPSTLVVACSYSGATAETLAALAAARGRGCPVVAVTSGGPLLSAARGEDGGPGFPAVVVPGGQPPRTALGAALGALLHVLARLDLLPDPSLEIAAACDHLEGGGLARDPGGAVLGEPRALALAKSLADRFVVIYTSGREAHGAGRRLLAQLNENAKTAGHVASFPELVHNEIVGWNLPPARRGQFALVALRGADESGADALRVEATLDLLADQFAGVHQVIAHGPSRLARSLGLILFGDLVSAHLAVIGNVDPVPIARIDALKARLRDR